MGESRILATSRSIHTAALIALVIVPPLCLGTVHPPVMVAVGAMVFIAAAVGLRSTVAAGRRARISALALACFVLGVTAAVQVIPLPPSVVEVIASQAYDARNALGLEGGGPLSLAPAQTSFAAAKPLMETASVTSGCNCS